jgi:hypothetical protein
MVFLETHQARTQSSGGVGQYYYMRTNEASTVVPVAYYQFSNKWYGEARYNYDELKTFAIYAGRTFSNKGELSYSATPVIGGLVGRMNGGSLGVNFDLEYKKLFFSSQSQYSFSMEEKKNQFFFNWSELAYKAWPWFYAGIGMQQTNVYQANGKFEPGLLVGFSLKNWTFPLYVFSPSGNNRYFILGINWEWEHVKKVNKQIDVTSIKSENEAAVK